MCISNACESRAKINSERGHELIYERISVLSTSVSEADWARIGYQRLSPLNVSVHAADPAVRRRLLNNRHAPAILPQLERLAGLGTQVNAQVVLCAGINDGAVLDRSIRDLAELHPGLRSLSVVPVGLTRFSRVKNIRRPTPPDQRARSRDFLGCARRAGVRPFPPSPRTLTCGLADASVI